MAKKDKELVLALVRANVKRKPIPKQKGQS